MSKRGGQVDLTRQSMVFIADNDEYGNCRRGSSHGGVEARVVCSGVRAKRSEAVSEKRGQRARIRVRRLHALCRYSRTVRCRVIK